VRAHVRDEIVCHPIIEIALLYSLMAVIAEAENVGDPPLKCLKAYHVITGGILKALLTTRPQ
jgi:hypothetical protein